MLCCSLFGFAMAVLIAYVLRLYVLFFACFRWCAPTVARPHMVRIDSGRVTQSNQITRRELRLKTQWREVGPCKHVLGKTALQT
jgi:hypothetical protein